MSATPIKVPPGSFTGGNHMEMQELRIDKTILKKKKGNKVEDLHMTISKLNYKAKISKAMGYWKKHRHINKWNRIESRKKLTYLWVIDF